jgi:exodeoxyribonuclease VII small subunit
MAQKNQPAKTYAEVLAELQEVLEWFQNSEVSVDAASEKYTQGMKLITDLEARLAVAEGEITTLTKQSE